MDKVRLTLYIAGRSPRSQRAIDQSHRICDGRPGECELVVVDILESPRAAEREKIMATPMLVKEWPEPTRRVIGDLSDVEQVLLGLEVPRPS